MKGTDELHVVVSFLSTRTNSVVFREQHPVHSNAADGASNPCSSQTTGAVISRILGSIFVGHCKNP